MGEGTRTLTFLFTDIESSTQRWAEDGDSMARLLAAHDDVLRSVIARHRGRVFKHTGDGICAVFESASDAAHAAQEARTDVPLPVRIGLHTGEAEERDGDWFGPALNRVARIMDAGHGGQVLCSRVTAALLPDGTARKVLGEYRLKGLDQAEPIVQIGDGDFPPLRAASTMITLPDRRSSLVGREPLLARLDAALASSRVVTLVGPGGVGKTSVAIESARRRTGLVDRTAFVDLTIVDDPDGVPLAVARALGLSAAELPAIRLAIGTGTTLLVMDNCEHVLDAAAEVVENLVSVVGPGVSVLATSRESLELDGEAVIAVAPLTDEESMIELFLDRAASVGAPHHDTALVGELCRRLDGLPLAIELAAARVVGMTPRQMVTRLSERFRLLQTRAPDLPERQRALRAAIDW